MSQKYRHCNQIVVNGHQKVPNHKPKIQRILRVTTTPVLTKIVVINKKVVFAGHLLIFLEYVASVPDKSQPVHFTSFKVPFADFVEHSCAHSGMKADLDVEIEFQEFHTIDDRLINKIVIFKVCIVNLKDKKYEPAPHPCLPHNLTPCPDEQTDCDIHNYHSNSYKDSHFKRSVKACVERADNIKVCPMCGRNLDKK
ncbi:MAG: DUF3794 domain-containing protein [Firmicutes bacterium]|nr:DUF3794 domain-containing protein [Bacillota bacterium]